MRNILIFLAFFVCSLTEAQTIKDGAIATRMLAAETYSNTDIVNLGLSTSVASSALTISVRIKDGVTNASSTKTIPVTFRGTTAASGDTSVVKVTGSLSVVVSSGSTLGTVNSIAAHIYVYLLNNAGTPELAVSKSLFDAGSVVSTTAEGGAGAADSATVMYSTTARSNVAFRLIGRLTLTESTAGTWATNASEVSVGAFEAPRVYNTSGIPIGIYGAFVTSGGVVTEVGGVDWISGNCSGSVPYTCTFVSGTFTDVVCQANNQTGATTANITSQSSSAVTITTYNSSTSATRNDAFLLTCIGIGKN